MSNQPKYKPNRLIDEKSPYLLQHAYNLVDWFPWGKEAFDKAKKEDKPVFLSIGYSSCHWCHVMERESFDNEEVAEVLNKDFVAIKVDKEERPDIDTVYMNVCQLVTGHGGWPNTIIMTPEQKPFFAATYLPKQTTDGRIGLIDLLEKTAESWKNNKKQLLDAADEIVSALTKEYNAEQENDDEIYTGNTTEKSLNDTLIRTVTSYFEDSFDERYGGFGSSPKFPTPHNLLLLMRIRNAYRDERAFEMVEKTLRQMYRGGIYDHIGGGFSRYSTDRMWLVPHFEKMLYDNALLVLAYAEAYKITEDELYKKVATETLDYILQEMTDPEGGFYSSQDADSEGVEGKYYLFNPDEINSILGEESGNEFCQFYDITTRGNFEGFNIPNLLRNRDYERIPQNITDMKFDIYKYRSERMQLQKDDKILTSWNGLMIAALAIAYRVFHEKKFLDAAERACTFVNDKLARKDGGLRVRYRDYEAAGKGFLDDYAYFTWGLLELYESTFKVTYLQSALDLNNRMISNFWDEKKGGFFMTAENSEKLLYRPKETYDGAMPSGNSVAAHNMIRLFRKMGSQDLEKVVEKHLRYLTSAAEANPEAHGFALLALSYYLKHNR